MGQSTSHGKTHKLSLHLHEVRAREAVMRQSCERIAECLASDYQVARNHADTFALQTRLRVVGEAVSHRGGGGSVEST